MLADEGHLVDVFAKSSEIVLMRPNRQHNVRAVGISVVSERCEECGIAVAC